MKMHSFDNLAKQQEVVFAAKLIPYRSLGRTGFLLLMGFVAFTCLISGILFTIIGAWPVMIFFGIDIALVWLAFKLNYRAARGYEEVQIKNDEINVRQILANGKSIAHSFNPFWTKFKIDRHKEYGVMKLVLSSKERELEIGSFLNAADKESFANAFGPALARVKS